MPTSPLPPPTAETPLLPWLLATLAPMSRTKVKELLGSGRVRVNGEPITQFDHPLKPGDRIVLDHASGPGTEALSKAKIAILYQDDAFLAIDKPAGLLTVSSEGEKTDTAFARLTTHLKTQRAGRAYVVHRIDRDTSGLVLFARTAAVRDLFQEQWERVTKTYLAITEGTPVPAEGVIETFLTENKAMRVVASPVELPGSKWSITRYRVLRVRDRRSLIEVGLETGRKHQIRVHLAKIGCPVIGDVAYRAKSDPAGQLGLHAWKLAFDHPITGQRIELESPLPEKLKKAV